MVWTRTWNCEVRVKGSVHGQVDKIVMSVFLSGLCISSFHFNNFIGPMHSIRICYWSNWLSQCFPYICAGIWCSFFCQCCKTVIQYQEKQRNDRRYRISINKLMHIPSHTTFLFVNDNNYDSGFFAVHYLWFRYVRTLVDSPKWVVDGSVISLTADQLNHWWRARIPAWII